MGEGHRRQGGKGGGSHLDWGKRNRVRQKRAPEINRVLLDGWTINLHKDRHAMICTQEMSEVNLKFRRKLGQLNWEIKQVKQGKWLCPQYQCWSVRQGGEKDAEPDLKGPECEVRAFGFSSCLPPEHQGVFDASEAGQSLIRFAQERPMWM